MTRSACSMAALVEAHFDGRLGEREAASIARHLRSCASCRELADDLRPLPEVGRIPVPELSPLEYQRGRIKLLQLAARRDHAPVRLRWFALVATTLLVGVALFAWKAVLAPRASARLANVSLRWSPPPAPARGLVMAALTSEAGARFTRHRGVAEELVALEDGAVRFSVRHLEIGERFLVRTRDAEVEVRGTIFRVEARLGQIRAVAVTEGRVEVRFAGTVTLLAAGESWSPGAPASRHAAVGMPQSKAETAGVRSPVAALSAESRPAEPEPSAESQPATAAAPSAERTAAFGEAVRMFERGDYGAAAGRLEAFSTAHPSDSRAEDAEFLAILALKRAGRASEAAALARRYLERRPNGYRRAEAEAIAAGR